jgi:hypothetical protein
VEAGSFLEDLEDLKITIDPVFLKEVIGCQQFSEIIGMFDNEYTEIVLRRCQAHGKFIKFHTDVSRMTLQVTLNSDTDYAGGKLVFATNGKLFFPSRSAGTITIHYNDIVHGVSVLESGVRYGLFFLLK